jgi:predicted amidohydrolase
MGKLIAQSTGHEKDIVYGEINLAFLEEVRRELPYLTQRREDLYKLYYKKGE